MRVTAKARKAMLRRELDRARDDVSPALYRLARMCERHPAPRPAVLAKAAHDLYLRVGKVAGFASMLSREV